MASREVVLASTKVSGVVDIVETSSYTESMLKEAQDDKEKSNEMTLGPDDSINTFFDGMYMSTLEDFSKLGHVEVPKKDMPRERANRA